MPKDDEALNATEVTDDELDDSTDDGEVIESDDDYEIDDDDEDVSDDAILERAVTNRKKIDKTKGVDTSDADGGKGRVDTSHSIAQDTEKAKAPTSQHAKDADEAREEDEEEEDENEDEHGPWPDKIRNLRKDKGDTSKKTEAESKDEATYFKHIYGQDPKKKPKDKNKGIRESADDLSTVAVQFMAVGGGNKKDNHIYTEVAVKLLADEIKRQPKMFISHSDPSQVARHGHRPLEQLAGIAIRESVHYDPARKATVGQVVLRPRFREYVDVAQVAGDSIGVSVDARGLFKPGTKDCIGWAQFHSADFVPKGGAGGFTLAPVRESDAPELQEEETEFTMLALESMQPEDIRENAAALYEAIGKEWADAHPVRETVAATVPNEEIEALVRENDALSSRLDEIEAERNREQVAAFVTSTIRECGVAEDKQIDYLARNFQGATCGPKGMYQTRDELETAVRESAKAFIDAIPAGSPKGEITGMGSANPRLGEGFTNPMDVVANGISMGIFGYNPDAKKDN